MIRPLGVILAGGLARRMGGGDKALRTLAGRPVLAHVLDRLTPQVEAVVLNANGDPRRFAGYDPPVIADSIAGHSGPLAGVLAGLEWAADNGAESIVTVAADTPFFPKDLVAKLLAACEGRPQQLAIAATPRGGDEALKSGGKYVNRHPTFGIWPVALREDLRDALHGGVRKIVTWTERHGAGEALFPTAPFDPFFNVNTPDDLHHAEKLFQDFR